MEGKEVRDIAEHFITGATAEVRTDLPRAPDLRGAKTLPSHR
jgi:hypothetical protein